MPIYEYTCPGPDALIEEGNTEDGSHVFEKIVPMADFAKPQMCPEHHKECQRVDYSPNAPWVWGYNEIRWDAGLASNPDGMAHAKKHQTLYKEKKG